MGISCLVARGIKQYKLSKIFCFIYTPYYFTLYEECVYQNFVNIESDVVLVVYLFL